MAAAPPIDVPRVRRCVGDPPRQTEDPQSPPCVPYWQGDNGGTTSTGVTKDTIRLVQAGGAGPDTAAIFQAYFNSRFEFYGRRIQIQLVGNGGNKCEGQKAAATDIAERVKAFAVLDSASATTACFHEELARRKVISGVTNTLFTEPEMAKLNPYSWQYDMAIDKTFSAVGQMACGRLAGKLAIHASDPLYQRTTRKFGILLQQEERSGDLDTKPVERTLETCGSPSALSLKSNFALLDTNSSADEVRYDQNAMIQMREKGVTTLVCMCTIFRTQYLSAAMTNQAYYPEIVLSSYFSNDANVLIKLFWQSDHREDIVGVTVAPPMRDAASEPAYFTAKQTAPQTEPKQLSQLLNAYRTLLLISSGIQMAGPGLTPKAFGDALLRTNFPNPPSKSGKVGFRNDHSMTDDAAEFWWSETTSSPSMHLSWSNGDPGAMCFVGNGARIAPGSWPTGLDPFYQGPCYADPGL